MTESTTNEKQQKSNSSLEKALSKCKKGDMVLLVNLLNKHNEGTDIIFTEEIKEDIFTAIVECLKNSKDKQEACLLFFCNNEIDDSLKQEFMFRLIGADKYHDFSHIFFKAIFELDLKDTKVNLTSILKTARIEIKQKEENERHTFIIKRGNIEKEITLPAAMLDHYNFLIDRAINNDESDFIALLNYKPEVVFYRSKNGIGGGDDLLKYSFFKLICTCMNVYNESTKSKSLQSVKEQKTKVETELEKEKMKEKELEEIKKTAEKTEEILKNEEEVEEQLDGNSNKEVEKNKKSKKRYSTIFMCEKIKQKCDEKLSVVKEKIKELKIYLKVFTKLEKDINKNNTSKSVIEMIGTKSNKNKEKYDTIKAAFEVLSFTEENNIADVLNFYIKKNNRGYKDTLEISKEIIEEMIEKRSIELYKKIIKTIKETEGIPKEFREEFNNFVEKKLKQKKYNKIKSAFENLSSAEENDVADALNFYIKENNMDYKDTLEISKKIIREMIEEGNIELCEKVRKTIEEAEGIPKEFKEEFNNFVEKKLRKKVSYNKSTQNQTSLLQPFKNTKITENNKNTHNKQINNNIKSSTNPTMTSFFNH